jgi:AcrR family transcriptional regulator
LPRPAYSTQERERIESEIRSTALRLFATLGYRATSMRAIGAELGLSATALYRYFTNKEDLLAQIRSEGFDDLRRQLNAVRTCNAPVTDKIGLALRTYLDFALARPEVYRLMYELDQGELAEEALVVQARRQAFGEAELIARELLVTAQVAGDPNLIAHIFWTGAHGLAALALANQLDLGKRYEELIGPLVGALTAGVPAVLLQPTNGTSQ